MVSAGPGVIYSDPLIDLSCEGILEELESLKGVIWLLNRMEVGLVFVDWVFLLLAGKASHVLLGPCVKCPAALPMVQYYLPLLLTVHLIAAVFPSWQGLHHHGM